MGTLFVVVIVETKLPRGKLRPRQGFTPAEACYQLPVKSAMAPGRQPESTGAAPTARPISLAELRRHASLKDAWIAVAGRVFDISEFIRTHPGMNGAGGATSTIVAIMNALGKDCTDDFTAIHSRRAWAQLETFCIGYLDGFTAGTSERWTGYDEVAVRETVQRNVGLTRDTLAQNGLLPGHVHRSGSSASISSEVSESFAFDTFNAGIGADSSRQQRAISCRELSMHSNEISAWVAVDGAVYDITELLRSGVLGSMATSMLSLGTDCTQIFKYIPALQSAKLHGCAIGMLVP